MRTIALLVVGLALACEGPPVEPAPILDGVSRVPRLTHDQWRQSVRDLTGLENLPAEVFALREDPNLSGAAFAQHGGLRVDATLRADYQRAAEAVARAVTTNADVLNALAPQRDRDAFIETHGRRAHRRPLSARDLSSYRALFDDGAEHFAELDPFVAGARIVLEAWLQSPRFIYRPELVPHFASERVPLDKHEIAARLSFALVGTMPDDALFAAADSGELSTAAGVRAQAERLIDEGAAALRARDFHARWLERDRVRFAQPSPSLNAPPELGLTLALAQERFTDDVWSTGGGLRALLTSTEAYVNDDTAPLYGLSGNFGDELNAVQLNADERRGILTMAGFLVENSAGISPDPIHRGVWISKELACNTIPPPPDDIPPFPAAVEGQTNREVVEQLTETPGTVCTGCHATLINPYGFPLEQYDALGRFRAVDGAAPIDPNASILLGQEFVDVTSGVELAETLAASEVVHACYAEHWARFVLGHDPAFDPLAEDVLVGIGRASTDDLSLKALVLELVSSPVFLSRPALVEVTP